MWFLALRQLISRPQQTLLTLLGIILGTAGYVLFSGIMLGFQTIIIDQLINSDGQIKITPRDEVINEETFKDIFFKDQNVKWLEPPSGRTDNSRLTNVLGWMDKLNKDIRVIAYAPQLSREVIFVKGKKTTPARLVGLDPQRHPKVTNLENFVFEAKIQELSTGSSLAIVGEGILNKLGARKGDILNVLYRDGTLSPIKVIGVLRTGNRMADDLNVYSSISSVRNITHSSGEISGIIVKLHDVRKAADIANEWSQYSRDKVESWDQANDSIMSVFKTQDIVRNSTTFTIILVVAFGIYSVLNMVVNQKKKEIAILRSIGFDEKDTVLLFLIQGIILGLIGAVLGLILGAFGCSIIEGIPIGGAKSGDSKSMIKMMKISWDPIIYVKAFIISLTSCALASYIPARTAAKLSPVDIIRGS
jgi:lipoprotein-releasing system permease protein